ncbi:MAG: GIY-YIG nuclease family protein [Candidatus Omnitrophica bacterium]|nr:GIY-YIG nuclease family protein [Candidatus Omnitrophota bacterium]
MLTKTYYVYLLTNRNNSVIYVGVTNDLKRRIFEHRNGFTYGFTKKYHVHKLVYYEVFEEIEQAILREKQIKGGSRDKKVSLIEKNNPLWNELGDDL